MQTLHDSSERVVERTASATREFALQLLHRILESLLQIAVESKNLVSCSFTLQISSDLYLTVVEPFVQLLEFPSEGVHALAWWW